MDWTAKTYADAATCTGDLVSNRFCQLPYAGPLVPDFTCEFQFGHGPWELVYNGQRQSFEFITRKDGIYSFRSRAWNHRGSGEHSEESALSLSAGEAVDPFSASAATERTSTKASAARMASARRKRALKRKQGAEDAQPQKQKQPKEEYVHKLSRAS